MKLLYFYHLFIFSTASFLFVYLATCTSQVDWIAYRGVQGSGATSDAISPPLGQRWKLRLQAKGQEARSFNPPIVKGDTIYFGSNDHNFYALDVKSGYMRWIFPTKNKVNSVPYIYEDTIYFGSDDGNVYAVNVKDGQERWTFQANKTVQSLVYRYEDRIIFTSDTGATYFVDPYGQVRDKIPNPTWSHHTFQVYNGIVYWVPKGRGFGAYNIKEKRFLWDIPINANFPLWYSFAALDETKIYFARNLFTRRGNGAEFTYYALDRNTGRTVWEKKSSFQWSKYHRKTAYNVFYRHVYLLDYLAPSLWKHLVIYTSGDKKVRAFRRSNGELVWDRDFAYHVSSAPTVAGDRVYFGVHGSELTGHTLRPPKLVCLAAQDGRLLWEMEVDGALLSAPVVSGQRILFGTEHNYFYILEEIF